MCSILLLVFFQMLDLVRPKVSGKITLADLKNCKMANIFFDTFFNLDKFLDHEQRDPFANARVSFKMEFSPVIQKRWINEVLLVYGASFIS